jgi:hypothetical protein
LASGLFHSQEIGYKESRGSNNRSFKEAHNDSIVFRLIFNFVSTCAEESADNDL